MTQEALGYIIMGTPEYRAYEAIPAEGIAQETLREKIGFDKDLMKIAFSNGVKKFFEISKT